jgi:hypothetical protein
MKRKTATKILSFIIISSFFLPLFKWHGFEMTGLNYILSDHIPSYKYLLLLAPLAAVLIFFDVLDERSFYINSKILSWIPLLSLALICIMRLSNVSAENSFDNETYFSTIDFGFWLMLPFSILLAIVNDGKRLIYQYEKNESDLFH